MKKIVCLGCGSCCSVIGLVLVCVMLGFLNPLKDSLYDVVHDMVYVDNTRDTDTIGGFEWTSEKKQYESMMRSTADSYEKCKNELKNGDTAEDTCFQGQLRVAAVFNVTNAEEVVMAGAKVKVQEIGPFYARLRTRVQMTDADKAKLDATGVATMLEEDIYTMEDCDAACEAMLEREIIIPNPIWGYASKAGIVQPFLLLQYLAQAGASAGQAAGIAGQTQTPTSQQIGVQLVMILAAEIQAEPAEVAAISADILAPAQAGDTSTAFGKLGVFLLGATRAATTGTGTCSFGGSLALPASRCGALLQALSGKIPSTWMKLMTMHASTYGTGSAAPVFMKAKIKEVLSYKTNTRDPLLQFNISLPCFEDSPINTYSLPSSYQVGSKFGEEGTSVIVGLGNISKNCKYDPDCTLSSTMKDSCVDSTICKPLHYKHYQTSQIAPRIWGKDKGFLNWGPGKMFPMFLAGIPLEMKIVKETSQTVDGAKLNYLEIRVNKMVRRIENCNEADAQDSPGIDCGGPKGTVNMGPDLALDAPMYASAPFFDPIGMEDYAGASAGDTNGYDPLTKVEMTKCTGHSWCDSGRPEVFRSELRAEPETGILYSGKLNGQLNVRLYHSPLQSNVPDAAVPVFWVQIVGEAPKNSLKELANIQNMPEFLTTLVIALTISGAVLFCCGIVCCGVGCKAARQQTNPKSQQMQGQPADLQIAPTPSSEEQGQAQTAESKEQQGQAPTTESKEQQGQAQTTESKEEQGQAQTDTFFI